MAIADILFQDTRYFIVEIPENIVATSSRGISFDGNNYESVSTSGGEYSHII